MGDAAPPTAGPRDPETRHGSCVAVGNRGLLILGQSGAGKSALALQLMAHGARLVADDRVLLTPGPGGITASAPPAIAGLIEARGLGLLRAEYQTARLVAVLDLDRMEADRLPPLREIVLFGHELPLLHAMRDPHQASALLQFLKAGRAEPEWPNS